MPHLLTCLLERREVGSAKVRSGRFCFFLGLSAKNEVAPKSQIDEITILDIDSLWLNFEVSGTVEHKQQN